MKKFITTVSILIILFIIITVCGTFAYAKSDDYSSDSFPESTMINGIDCSGLTYDEAVSKLTEEWNKKHIVVTGQLNDDIASFTDFGCTYDIAKSIRNSKKDSLVFAAANHFISTPLIIQIPMIVSDCSDQFKEQVMSSSFLNSDDDTVSQDAYVDLSKDDFPIVPEVYGTKPDAEKFLDDLLLHIQTDEFRFLFDPNDYYDLPEVTADDDELLKYQKYCRKYLNQKITYSLGEETFTLTPETISSLLMDDRSGKVNEAAVKEYVASLAAEYDNIGKERVFKSLSGKEVHVKGGTYGWTIDQEKETEQLTADISSHKDVTREPVFSEKGYGEYSRNVGDTYIDVDISAQTVRFYIDGALQFSSSCVTGCRATGTTTDTGTYYILNKVRNVVLRGNNADGSKYESPVKYWLGVTWTGQGFHDANWRGAFGGSIWISNGSHGCVNMPPSRMPALYNLAEVGTPVVIHY